MVEGVGVTRGAPLVQNQGRGFGCGDDRGGLRWKVGCKWWWSSMVEGVAGGEEVGDGLVNAGQWFDPVLFK